MVIGSILAHVSGYFGGAIDWIIGRAVDVWMSFPPVILSLILMVGLGIGLDKVILAIVLVDWTRFCRVLRSEVLIVTRRDYVAAACRQGDVSDDGRICRVRARHDSGTSPRRACEGQERGQASWSASDSPCAGETNP
jgi:ABC-type microcin C transport system permease subunit YejE